MFGHWDGVFFLEIAEHGYHWDKFYAFFPGYPLLLRIVADSGDTRSFLFLKMASNSLPNTRSSCSTVIDFSIPQHTGCGWVPRLACQFRGCSSYALQVSRWHSH